ncbi:Lrp/AsnC family transcriptional regulator [Candidatus Micrarchaeota archaeon]|nr:Lrp/AsnC family transcriptional regulator [Candidatus Micrarchaeota archaeon]
MDERDRLILDVLRKNCKLSTCKIARLTNLPPTSVYYRVKKLESSGVIRRYSAVLDEAKMGLGLSAHVFVKINAKELREQGASFDQFLLDLYSLPGVQEMHYVTGRYDVVLKVAFKDMQELNDLLVDRLKRTAGIESTETTLTLKKVTNAEEISLRQ